jgi:hypothetical protein
MEGSEQVKPKMEEMHGDSRQGYALAVIYLAASFKGALRGLLLMSHNHCDLDVHSNGPILFWLL